MTNENGGYEGEFARWQAVVTRDTSADGTFVYAVLTTGIFCKPGCPARTPKYENARFFETPTAAQKAGYRACLRCRPLGQDHEQQMAQQISSACRLICGSETPPTTNQLADRAGLGASHFHRLFRSFTGMTPKAYTTSCRLEKLRRLLSGGQSVTSAFYEAGFNSSSRFYETAPRLLGMPPQAYRSGGTGQQLQVNAAPIGGRYVGLASSMSGPSMLEYCASPAEFQTAARERFPRADLQSSPSQTSVLLKAVGQASNSSLRFSRLGTDVRDTIFRHRLWQLLAPA